MSKIHTTDMSREMTISTLKELVLAMQTYDSVTPTPTRINALQFAIESLEVDEKYQLEYEGVKDE